MMPQQFRRNVRPSMATLFQSLPEDKDLSHIFYMFTQDIHLSIMPIDIRTNEQECFTAILEGGESKCGKAKVIIGNMGGHDRNSTSEMICDAVRKITEQLSLDGQVFFEIIQDDTETNVARFPSKNLFRIFSWYLQIIPVGDRDLWRLKYTLISKKKVWTIKIPHRLGGKNKHKKIIKKLKNHSLVPRFYKQGLESGAISNSYDYDKYRKYSEVYVNRVTNQWGWNKRDFHGEKSTQFYMAYKMLIFRWAQAVLREHIISEINQLLNGLSIDCKIVVTGLPTEDEILQTQNDMKNGEIDFVDALKKTEV